MNSDDIKNKITEEMSNFIVNEIQKLIDDEKFETIYELEKIKFGKYFIRYSYNDDIIFYNGNISFLIPRYNTKPYFKTFLGIKYGKELNKETLTKYGEKLNEFENAQKDFEFIKENKEILDYLPKDVKNNIIRKEKFKNIIVDENEN